MSLELTLDLRLPTSVLIEIGFKIWAYPGLCFVHIRPFIVTITTIQSIDGVIGIRTHGRMFVSCKETAVLNTFRHRWDSKLIRRSRRQACWPPCCNRCVRNNTYLKRAVALLSGYGSRLLMILKVVSSNPGTGYQMDMPDGWHTFNNYTDDTQA